MQMLFAPLEDHSFTCARGEQAKWLRGGQEKHRSSVMQDENLPPFVFAKGLRDRNSPTYTFSQNGYCAQGQGKEVSLLFDTG